MSNKLNILFVHEVDYFAKPIYEIHEFPEHLASLGHNVTFLEFNENRRHPKPARSRRISGRVLPGVQLTLETPIYTGVLGLDRLLAVITCLPKLFSLLKSGNFDVVVLYAVPTYGLQTILISKIFGVPVIHRALDVPHKIRESIYEPLIRLSEKLVYKLSTVVTANNSSLASYCDQVGRRKKPSLVQLPPLDLEAFKHENRSEALANELEIAHSDQVITYLGSFFYFSGLPQVIKDFKLQIENNPRLKLLLIGGGEQDKQLRSLVSELKLESRVVFTGFIPFAKIPEYLSLGDVAINPMENVISANLALPHKVLQYLACGLPVVSTKLTGLHSALGEESGVTWVEGPQGVLTAASELLNHPDLTIKFVNQARESLNAKFEMKNVIGKFEGTLKSITKATDI